MLLQNHVRKKKLSKQFKEWWCRIISGTGFPMCLLAFLSRLVTETKVNIIIRTTHLSSRE